MSKPMLRPQAPVSHSSGQYLRAIRQVVTRPHPVLDARALEADPCDPEIVALCDALVATMRASPACVGLAATQLGEPVRVFCMDVTGHPKARSCAGLVVMVNPRIVARFDEARMREGCMSVPHLTGDVVRAARVIVDGLEPGTGRVVRISADAIEARCLQHEIDHLDGALFVDRVRDAARDLHDRKSYALPPAFVALRRSVLEAVVEAIQTAEALPPASGVRLARGAEPRALAELRRVAGELADADTREQMEDLAERAEALIASLGGG